MLQLILILELVLEELSFLVLIQEGRSCFFMVIVQRNISSLPINRKSVALLEIRSDLPLKRTEN